MHFCHSIAKLTFYFKKHKKINDFFQLLFKSIWIMLSGKKESHFPDKRSVNSLQAIKFQTYKLAGLISFRECCGDWTWLNEVKTGIKQLNDVK